MKKIILAILIICFTGSIIGCGDTDRIQLGDSHMVLRAEEWQERESGCVAPSAPLGDFNAIQNWLQSNWTYIKEPGEWDYWQTSCEARINMSGDCEDYAALALAELRASGYTDIGIAIMRSPRLNTSYHLAAFVVVSGERVFLDMLSGTPYGETSVLAPEYVRNIRIFYDEADIWF